MKLLAVAIVLACQTAHAEELPDRLGVDAALEVGALLATHGKVTVSYGRHGLDDQLFVEGRLGLGSTGSLLLGEARLGLGFVFHPNRRVDLLVGWRIGDSYFRGNLGGNPLAVNLLSIELAIQLALKLTPSWRMRVVPLAPALYWHTTYSFTLGFELGVERAF